jgi:hypothetical protein
VSLQGTLDTFAVPDVLRLLASTRKTGHLALDGERGHGDVWVDAGQVVRAAASTAPTEASPGEVVFELLRSRRGAFTFAAGELPDERGRPVDVEPLLGEAEALLVEWAEIEAVVPGLDTRVALSPDLPEPSVSVSAAQWRLLVAVGSGSTVGGLGAALDLGERDVSRATKDLVEAGLVTATRGGAGDPHRAETTTAPPVPATSAPGGEPSLMDAPELARRLAQLGPDAAQAVATAASAETPEERDAALATIEAEVDGEPIDHGLLLKFLSSIRS